MNENPDAREVFEEEDIHQSSTSDRQSPRTGFDSEAVENFAEVLAILRAWAEGERGEAENGASNDADGPCSTA